MSNERGILHESDVLLRQIDSQLARESARESGSGAVSELAVAETIAAALRKLVAGTDRSCATDRARVRAAVHFFVVRRDVHQDRRPARPVSADIRVINEIMHDLGRDDLVIDAASARVPLSGAVDVPVPVPVPAGAPSPAGATPAAGPAVLPSARVPVAARVEAPGLAARAETPGLAARVEAPGLAVRVEATALPAQPVPQPA